MRYLISLLLIMAAGTLYGEEILTKSDRNSFAVTYKGITSNNKIVSCFIFPQEQLEIKINDKDNEKFSADIAGETKELSDRRIVVGQEKEIVITKNSTSEKVIIKILRKIPFRNLKDGCINGYTAGEYPPIHPAEIEKLGFIEINENNKNEYISPNFTLGEFRSKPLNAKLPVYIVLDERVVHKVETLLDIFRSRYYFIEKFEIMSAYRTPNHNKKLKNVKLSRHLFGDAVDVFVDTDKNGKMDDINKDGKVNQQDLKILFDIVEEMDKSEEYGYLKGGLSMYESNPVVGEFLHIDARGTSIRW